MKDKESNLEDIEASHTLGGWRERWRVGTQVGVSLSFVYYESIKRELKKRLILECRCEN